MKARAKLPLHPDSAETARPEPASCGPDAYVSHEEQHILSALRDLRARAKAIREELEPADDTARRELEARLQALRAERQGLVARREAAYRRKMIMLGHVEPTESDLAAFPDLRS